MTPWQTLVLLIVWVPPVVAGVLIGRRRGRPWLGAVLGAVLWWLGVLVIALVPARAERR
jgi:hypothetical protein